MCNNIARQGFIKLVECTYPWIYLKNRAYISTINDETKNIDLMLTKYTMCI